MKFNCTEESRTKEKYITWAVLWFPFYFWSKSNITKTLYSFERRYSFMPSWEWNGWLKRFYSNKLRLVRSPAFHKTISSQNGRLTWEIHARVSAEQLCFSFQNLDNHIHPMLSHEKRRFSIHGLKHTQTKCSINNDLWSKFCITDYDITVPNVLFQFILDIISQNKRFI